MMKKEWKIPLNECFYRSIEYGKGEDTETLRISLIEKECDELKLLLAGPDYQRERVITSIEFYGEEIDKLAEIINELKKERDKQWIGQEHIPPLH